MEIQGYPGYLIYPDGRVYSNKKRKRFLKPEKNTKTGYLRLGLTNQYGQKKFSIHRLIALHYIPNPNNLSDVDHIDRDKTNNNMSNLRWLSHIDNMQNRGISKNNKCGIKNIRYNKRGNLWRYTKIIRGNNFTFSNKNKNIVLWCKFAHYILTK